MTYMYLGLKRRENALKDVDTNKNELVPYINFICHYYEYQLRSTNLLAASLTFAN